MSNSRASRTGFSARCSVLRARCGCSVRVLGEIGRASCRERGTGDWSSDVCSSDLLAERLKLVVEPTGALGAAAALERIIPIEGQRVGIVLSGGNVELARFAHWL